MNAAGDLGDLSEFTISSANDDETLDARDSPVTDNEFSQYLDADTRRPNENVKAMRIELSTKTMELNKYRKEFYQREEELQDRIDALIKQRDMIQFQLETEIKKNQEETMLKQQQYRKQLEKIENHQRYLEQTNSKLVESTIELKNLLAGDLQIDDERYENLKLSSEFELSQREFVQMKIHEMIKPLLRENKELKLANIDVNCEKNEAMLELGTTREMLNEVRQSEKELQESQRQLLLELSETKDKVKVGNYKVENFERVLKENDRVKEEILSIKSSNNKIQLELTSLLQERDRLFKENSDNSQSVRLMEMDKSYLTKQVNELSIRCSNAEDRLHTAWKQLEETKESRDNLYDKYVTSRDESRQQYESRLKDELDGLRSKTEQEIEKIKISTRELFDRDLKSCQEQREIALQDREVTTSKLQDLQDKYDKLRMETNLEKTSLEHQCSELMSQLKLKSFELERTSILYDETCQKLKMVNLDVEKFQEKFNVLMKEYYQLESSSTSKINELQSKLESSQSKLDSYDQLEKELDLAVMNAADKQMPEDTVLYPEFLETGHGMSAGGAVLPSASGRRMQQSIELARRVLHLERMLREKTETIKTIESELENAQSNWAESEKILQEAKQPYEYLIESLRGKESEINRLKTQLTQASNEITQLRNDKARLCKEKNKLLSDLELLMTQQNEISNLKNMILQPTDCSNNETILKLPNQQSINSNNDTKYRNRNNNPTNRRMHPNEYGVSRS